MNKCPLSTGDKDGGQSSPAALWYPSSKNSSWACGAGAGTTPSKPQTVVLARSHAQDRTDQPLYGPFRESLKAEFRHHYPSRMTAQTALVQTEISSGELMSVGTAGPPLVESRHAHIIDAGGMCEADLSLLSFVWRDVQVKISRSGNTSVLVLAAANALWTLLSPLLSSAVFSSVRPAHL